MKVGFSSHSRRGQSRHVRFGIGRDSSFGLLQCLGIEVAPDDNFGILPFEKLNHILTRTSGNEHRAIEEQSIGSTGCGERCVTVRSNNNAQIPSASLLGLLNEVGYAAVLERLRRLEVL